MFSVLIVNEDEFPEPRPISIEAGPGLVWSKVVPAAEPWRKDRE